MAAKISISLTDEHAELLHDAVGSGAYASSSEVVREALREWRARRAVGQLWDEGLASGRCEPALSMADIKREARQKRPTRSPKKSSR
jgi:antitoxin ParD1/3/4